MDNWSFGLTMTVVGLGGTFVTLGILIVFIEGLKKVLPFNPERDK
ncbi:MAG: OadG-related small transporter subunit [Desulfomonilaceae bacterium]